MTDAHDWQLFSLESDFIRFNHRVLLPGAHRTWTQRKVQKQPRTSFTDVCLHHHTVSDDPEQQRLRELVLKVCPTCCQSDCCVCVNEVQALVLSAASMRLSC